MQVADRVLQILFELPGCNRFKVNDRSFGLTLRSFLKQAFANRIDQIGNFRFRLFDRLFEFPPPLHIAIVFGLNLFQVDRFGSKIGGVPRVEKLAAISEIGCNKIDDGPVFEVGRVKEQKRFKQHLHAGGASFIKTEGTLELRVGCCRQDTFKLKPL